MAAHTGSGALHHVPVTSGMGIPRAAHRGLQVTLVPVCALCPVLSFTKLGTDYGNKSFHLDISGILDADLSIGTISITLMRKLFMEQSTLGPFNMLLY